MEEVPDKLNPLDIPEVLKLVFEYVGGAGVNGGTVQLLKARLVCRSWTEQATKLIPPQVMTLSEPELNSPRAAQLVELLEHYNASVPGVGLRLKTEINHVAAGLYFIYTDSLCLFMNRTRHMCPISILHLNSYAGMTENTFYELIQTISTSLKELKVRARLSLSTSTQQQQETSIENIQFPVLEHLDFVISPSNTDGTSLPPIPNLLITMLQHSSCTLKSLKLTERVTPSRNDQIKIESLGKLLNETQATLNNLKTLEIRIFNNESLLGSFFSVTFNNLECLTLHEVDSCHLQPVFLQFLLAKVPCLTNLHIILMRTPSALATNPTSLEFDQLNYFPIVHKISHLGLMLSGKVNPIKFMKNLQIMAQIFTNASNFILDTATCIYLSQVPSVLESLQDGGEYQGLVYPSVTSLCIKAQRCDRTFGDDDEVITLRLICNKIWPNASRLIIEEIDDIGRFNVVESGTLFTLLSLHNGITMLELKTRIMEPFGGDWLQEICRPNTAEIEELKENLRVLILRSPKSSLKPKYHVAADISIYLSNICETFPNLQRCCIEEILLSNYEQLGFQELLDQMEFGNNFPNITFDRFNHSS